MFKPKGIKHINKAESVNANTICLSSCAKSSTDPEIKCNTSANSKAQVT